MQPADRGLTQASCAADHHRGTLSATRLLDLARAAARRFQRYPAVLYLGANHLAYPVALFGAALAGVPLIPVNYRLGEAQLAGIVARHSGALVLRPDALDALLQPDASPQPEHENRQQDPDGIAVLIYTSGTTAEPKAAVLRHRHLLAYVWNTCEFGSAEDGDAALVAAPPYHIAGLTNLLSNLYTGRRVVYAAAYDAAEWLDMVRRERITHAMVVPTMLARIVAEVAGDDAETPTLRSLAYGGARTPRFVLERALRIFPEVGWFSYAVTRSPASTAAGACWTRTAGSPPGTSDTWTPTATCSSRGAPTTRSSGAARTSPRRDRGCAARVPGCRRGCDGRRERPRVGPTARRRPGRRREPGRDPAETGLAPVKAIPKALARAGLLIEDVNLFEINEAFAAMCVATVELLSIDPGRVNVSGSGCSLGHPVAASGARMLVTLVHELRRRGGGVGVAAMCAGGGMASATVIEVPAPQLASTYLCWRLRPSLGDDAPSWRLRLSLGD